ncbi:MAG: hypothetical protein WB919_10990 [Candidatus Sulfotelmatobacter sp.]
MTQLEPRTPHQPAKLKKLSKNDLVVLFLNFESIKSVRVYLVYFQASAGRPQEGDRILCSVSRKFMQRVIVADLAMPEWEGGMNAGFWDGTGTVNIE